MYSAIAKNKRNTYLIVGLFIAIIAGLGWIFSPGYTAVSGYFGALWWEQVYMLCFSTSWRPK